MARHPQNIVQNRGMDWDVTCSRWPIAINMCYRRELSLLDKKQDLCLANNALYYSLNLEQQFSLVRIYENIHMLPKRNKGPPASSGEKRWDLLHSVAIWLDMPYKILTHWTWLNCGIFHPERRSLLHRSLRLLQCSSGYMTFSKSCKDRMILSSWKQGEDIPMKPAWTSTIQNSVAAPAGSSLALGMPSPSGSWDWSVLQPWAGLGHTKHRVFSWAWCPAQAVLGRALGWCLCSALTCPWPWVCKHALGYVLHKPKWNGRFDPTRKLPWGSISCQKFQFKHKTRAILQPQPLWGSKSQSYRQRDTREILDYFWSIGILLWDKNQNSKAQRWFPPTEEFSYSKS